MKYMSVKKNDGQVIKIKLSESFEITSSKIQKLMDKHPDLTKKHWAGIIAILSGINRYSYGERGNIRINSGLQGVRPAKQAKNWFHVLNFVKCSPLRFKVSKSDVVHAYIKLIQKDNSIVFEWV